MIPILTGCQDNMKMEETEEYSILDDFTYELSKNDTNIDCSESVEIDLSQQNGELILSEAGKYKLIGNMIGNIYIDVEDDNIYVCLAGVDVESRKGPVISVLSAGKVFITVEEGTKNELSDSINYDSTKEENACIYSVCDLTMNGNGELIVTGLYKDAIHCKDTLKILNSNLKVMAKRDGLRGSDGVLIDADNVVIETEGNGVRTTKTGKNAKGTIEIKGNDISVISGKYCLNSASNLKIHEATCYLNGVLGRALVAGETKVDEGCLGDETL